MAHDRRPILTQLTDKVQVKEYARSRGVKTPKTLHLADTAQAIPWNTLPESYAFKANHGSNWLVIVHNGVVLNQPDIPTIKDNNMSWHIQGKSVADVQDRLLDIGDLWVRHTYSLGVEWAYEGITPRLFVEELLPGNPVPEDLKFYVFHGKVRLVHVNVGRFDDHRLTVYTPDWIPLDVTMEFVRGPVSERPANLTNLLHTAETLAGDLDFVRVDLYNVNEVGLLGEMDFYSRCGEDVFNPPSFDKTLGDWW